MKFVSPSAEIIKEDNMFKQIERIGRICYKSESNITEDSAARFVKTLARNQHYAMLEHAVFTVRFDTVDLKSFIEVDLDNGITPSKFIYISINDDNYSYVSANLRYMFEGSGCLWSELFTCLCRYAKELVNSVFEEDFSYSDHVFCNPHGVLVTDIGEIPEDIRDYHDFRSVKFVTDRGVSHELVRHRVASFAQSSTRYCNYAKDKFGSEITYIRSNSWDDMSENELAPIYDSLKAAESAYMKLISDGYTPQFARAVLPNQLMTEIVVTANMTEWHHICNLRYLSTTGSPHPDMRDLMDRLHDIMPEMAAE